MTGQGVKQEEHIYEDPLYLKSCEAYTGSEPIYKVPRPVSLDQNGSDDAGYEIIPPPATKPKPRTCSVKNSVTSESPRRLEKGSADPVNSAGYYEIMQHPSSLGKDGGTLNLVEGASLPSNSPAPYLRPVGVSDSEGIEAGYSLLQRTAGTHSTPDSRGEDRGYANLLESTLDRTEGTRTPTEYTAMKPVS